MRDISISIIILIVSAIHVFADNENNIILSEIFGGTGGKAFSFANQVGGKYPINMTIYSGSVINKVGFTYYEHGFISAGSNGGSAKSYTFQDNEFINYMKVCKVEVGSNRYRVSFLYFKTNLNKELSYGNITDDCQIFEPSDGYAIVGFHGMARKEIDSIGCIYQIFYYDCPKLDEGKFCNYNHTKVLSEMPDGYFLNSTEEKTIDKCYSTCKKCINYGNENNHNCSGCISNYVYLDEPDVKLNCFETCLNYIFDKNLNEYKCTTQGFSLIHKSLDQTKNEIVDEIDKFIKDKIPEKSYIIDGANYTIFINPIGRYLNESNVNIDFSECEKILKENYPNYNFRILQINSKNSNPNCLNEDVEYIVYNQFGERMDLSICKNVTITIQNKIDKTALDLEKIIFFQNKGIDIFQLEDDFFSDICYPYSDENSGSDMILKDRVSDIYQNYSLCEKDCNYESFNSEPIYVNCSCNVKQEISKENKEGNYKSYLKNFFYSNFGIIKCYKLVFGIKGKLKNIGFWLFGILILFHLPIYTYYYRHKINPIKDYINTEMEKYEYKTQTKDNESPDDLRTTENILEKDKKNQNLTTKKIVRQKKI